VIERREAGRSVFVVLDNSGAVDSEHAFQADAEARASALEHYDRHAVDPMSRSGLHSVIEKDPVIDGLRKMLPARGTIKHNTEVTDRQILQWMGIDPVRMNELRARARAQAGRRLGVKAAADAKHEQRAQQRADVASLLTRGITTSEIAKRLNLSTGYVRKLRREIKPHP
jgi:DNA-binding CsgD family transcriptional regulator